MNLLRSRSIRYVMVSLLAMSLMPWIGSTWTEPLQTQSSDARAAWLQGHIDSWPSDADRDAFQRAVSDAPAGPWTTPEQFTASVLQGYEAHAPDGHTAADLFGWAEGSDVEALAHWLHQQASQWDATATTPRVASAIYSVLVNTRGALESTATLAGAHAMDRASSVAHTGQRIDGERRLIRSLVHATPRAP